MTTSQKRAPRSPVSSLRACYGSPSNRIVWTARFKLPSSLGGVLKRKGRYVEALEMYRRATGVSNGHPYPLLNEVKLQARAEGRLQIDDRRRFQLARAERSL